MSNDWTSTIPTRRRTDTGPQKLSSQSSVHRNIEDMLQVIWNENEEIDSLEDDQNDIQEDDDVAQFVDDSMEMEQEDAKPLKQEVQAMTYGNNFHCDRCAYATRQHGNLKRHTKIVHTGVKDFQCDSCKATFSEKRILENHYRCQFHQHFTRAYLYRSALRCFSLLTACLCNFLAKAARKMLMKLTTDRTPENRVC